MYKSYTINIAWVCMLSCFFATLWTVAHQAPLSMGFSRQEYRSGLLCPPPGDLSDSGIEPAPPATLALQVDSLPLSHQGICVGNCMYVCVCVWVCISLPISEVHLFIIWHILFQHVSPHLSPASTWNKFLDSSIYTGFSTCSTWAQSLQLMGLVALKHVESSWSRDWTCVPCIGRQILIHCTPGKSLLSTLPPKESPSSLNSQAVTVFFVTYLRGSHPFLS